MAREPKIKAGSDSGDAMQRRLREAAFLLIAPVAAYLLLCLITYSPHDPGWSRAPQPGVGVHNFGGTVGAFLADVLFNLFGYLAYAFPLLLLLFGWVLFGAATASRILRLSQRCA